VTVSPDLSPPVALPPTGRHSPKAALWSVCLSLVCVVASVSGLNSGLAELTVDLQLTQTDVQWVVDGYVVALAALVLPLGALGDRIGRRRMLVGGTILFGLAGLFGALATSAELLIAARVLMGIGAAAIMPATLATITSVFVAEERARAVGLWAGVAGGGSFLGGIASGLLLEWFSWNSIFYATSVLAALALVGTLLCVPETEGGEGAHASNDPVGAGLSIIAIGSIIFGIIEGAHLGWTNPTTLLALTIGVAAAVSFVLWELRNDDPMLDPRVFRSRGLSTGTVTLLLQFLAAMGFFFVSSQYLLLIIGYSPLMASVSMIPLLVIMMPLSVITPVFVARFGIRAVSVAGILAMMVGFAVMTLLTADSGYFPFLGGMVVFGAGMALSTTPATNAIVSSLPADKQGVASALNDTTREIGAAFGIAILGAFFNVGYRASIASTADALPNEVSGLVRDAPATALSVAGTVGGDVESQVRTAFMSGMDRSLFAGMALLSVGLVYVLIAAPRGVLTDDGREVDVSDDPDAPDLDLTGPDLTGTGTIGAISPGVGD